MSRNVEELSQMVVDVLCEHRGFEDFWLSQDEDKQESILEDIMNAVIDWQSENGGVELEEDDELMR